MALIHGTSKLSALMIAVSIVLKFFDTTACAAVSERLKLIPQVGHSASVSSLAYNSQKHLLASGSYDDEIKIWDAQTGRVIHTLTGSSMKREIDPMVAPIAFNPDGSLLASVSSGDGLIRLWNPVTGQQIQALKQFNVKRLTFSPDGAWLIADNRVWDTTRWTDDDVYSLPARGPIAFLDKDRLLAIGRAVSIWNTKTWKVMQEIVPKSTDVLNDEYKHLAIDRRGRWVAIESKGDISIWTLPDMRLVANSAHGLGQVNTMVVTSNSKWIVVSSQAGVYAIARENLEEIRKLEDEPAVTPARKSIVRYMPDPTVLVVSEDSERVFSGNRDDGSIHVWRLKSGKSEGVWRPWATHFNHLFWPDLQSIYVDAAERSDLLSLNLSRGVLTPVFGTEQITRHMLGRMEGFVGQRYWATFPPGGGLRFAVGGTFEEDNLMTFDFDKDDGVPRSFDIEVRDLTTGSVIQTLGRTSGELKGFSMSRGGRFVAIAKQDPETQLVVWDSLNSNQSHPIIIPGTGESVLAVSTKGDLIAINWTIWNIVNGTAVSTITRKDTFNFSPRFLEFSPDDHLLAVATDIKDRPVIKMFDVQAGEEIATLENPHAGLLWSISDCSFSSDGKWFAWVNGHDTIEIWNVQERRSHRILGGLTQQAAHLAFSPDSENPVIAAANREGSIFFWDVESGESLATIIVGKDGRDWFGFTPEGFFDGSRQGWQLAPFRFESEPLKLYEPEQFFKVFYQPGVLWDVISERTPISKLLQRRGDPRASLDLSKYRRSQLPRVQFLEPPPDVQREIIVQVEAIDKGSGLRDCRVFRNGSLVHFERGDLKADPTNHRYRFRARIKLVAGPNHLSSYCFNRDDLKSKDATLTVTGNKELERKGTVYVLAIGINQYADSKSARTLTYAVSDATEVAKLIKGLEERSSLRREYTKVVPVELLDRSGTKENILTALGRLAADYKPIGSTTLKELEKFHTTEPEDLVVMFFAGHGMAEVGRYYLVPHDNSFTGSDTNLNKDRRSALLNHFISDQDLEAAFEHIDARHLVLIIDACQSGQALETEEKRQGPFNSKGLGQLSHDKGMYVLSASQTHESAVELQPLGHGLMTSVLLEGLGGMKADRNPKDGQLAVREWFDYVVEQVPRTYQTPQAFYRREADTGQLILAK